MPIDTIETAWRENNVLGDEGSGKYKPLKAPQRRVLKRIEASAAKGMIAKATLAALTAITNKADDTPGMVYADPVKANNGYYTSTLGVWTQTQRFGETFARLTITGGTVNAVQASIVAQVDPANVEAFYIDVPTLSANSGNVTVAINGGAPIPAYNINGDQFAAGEWQGRIFLSNEGSSLKALVDAAAAMSAALSAAQAEADRIIVEGVAARLLDPAATDPTTRRDGSPLQEGDQYYNTTLGLNLFWNGAAFDNVTSAPAATISDNEFVGDGVETDFVLSTVPGAESVLWVSVGGLVQRPSNYSLSGSTVTFSTAPPDLEPVLVKVVSTVGISVGSAVMTTLDDAAGYFDSGNVEGALAELGQHITFLTTTSYIDTPEAHGAVGDGVADDTAAVLAALNSGAAEIRFAGEYSCGLLTVPTSVKGLIGRSGARLIQRALGTNLLTGTGLTDLVMSVDLYGAASMGSVPASSNDAISLIDCLGVTIENCTIERFLFRPIIGKGGDHITARNVHFLLNAVGPRFIGTEVLRILDNHIDGTCLDASQFTTGIGLESTDGYAYPVCKDVWIRGNLTEGLGLSQGILVHGGIDVSLTENTVKGSTIGISLNPYNTTDFINYPVVRGNHVEGGDGVWAFGTNGCSGINVQAGPASGGGDTPDIASPRITDNMILSGNREKKGTNEGGLVLSYANDAIVNGNTIVASGANGIVMYEAIRANCGGNNVSTVLASGGGQQNGILCLASSTGSVHDNNLYAVGTAVDKTASAGITTSDNVSL